MKNGQRWIICATYLVWLNMILFRPVVVTAAEPIDWNRYCIEGKLLSGNFEARSGLIDPIPMRVEGRSAEEATGLVDSRRQTGIDWNAGETVDVVLDLKAVRHVAGIVVSHQGATQWRIWCSQDQKAWQPVPPERIVAMGNEATAAANLAIIAQFVRVTATPTEFLRLSDVWVFGEDDPRSPIVGSVYPSSFPPVVNEQGTLRAVIRNSSSHDSREDVVVEFCIKNPATTNATLLRERVAHIPPGASIVVSTPWVPKHTEPHAVVVRVMGAGMETSEGQVTIPVVNRRLYFGNFAAPVREQLPYSNVYMNIGGGHEPFLYYLVKFRGRIALASCEGPQVLFREPKMPNVEDLVVRWGESLSAPLRDGIGMDEWSLQRLYPDACEALNLVAAKRAGRMIVPWLIGGATRESAEAFRNVDLVFQEIYLNILGHNTYRSFLSKAVADARQHSMMDRWIVALGVFTSHRPSTVSQIEREVRFLKACGPEMAGITFYIVPGWLQPELDTLAYTYFIAPVVTWDATPTVEGQTARIVYHNTGGMTAYDVSVAAVDALNHERLGTATIAALQPGEKRAISFTLARPAEFVDARALPGNSYTVLAPPSPLEVLPALQHRGGPIQICWTPKAEAVVASADRLEIIRDGSGELVHVVTNDARRWEINNGNVYFRNLDTTPFPSGKYAVRIVGDATARPQTAEFTITESPQGRFFVSKINQEVWSGDPQKIKIKSGDTFDVAWDQGESSIPDPVIYLCPPGATPSKGGSGQVPLAKLALKMRNPQGDPVRKGSWTWKTDLEELDLASIRKYTYTTGWISEGQDPKSPRINMARNPGFWHLWIGMQHAPRGWSVPASPVIAVDVEGSDAGNQENGARNGAR